jgi:hypothetical protein
LSQRDSGQCERGEKACCDGADFADFAYGRIHHFSPLINVVNPSVDLRHR